MHRYLLRTLDQSHLMDGFNSMQVPAAAAAVGQDYGSDAATGSKSVKSPIGTNNQTAFVKSLTSYTLEDAMDEAYPWKFSFAGELSVENNFSLTTLTTLTIHSQFTHILSPNLTLCAVMVYDPTSDKFIAYYPKNQGIRSSFIKLQSGMRHLSFMLKKSFPERFTPTSHEFVVAISSGDYPHVNLKRMPHTTGKAPVLQFGSVFRDTESLYPNMIAMPMPGMHVKCFAQWADERRVCAALRPMQDGEVPGGELAFGKELELEWDNLKVSKNLQNTHSPKYSTLMCHDLFHLY